MLFVFIAKAKMLTKPVLRIIANSVITAGIAGDFPARIRLAAEEVY